MDLIRCYQSIAHSLLILILEQLKTVCGQLMSMPLSLFLSSVEGMVYQPRRASQLQILSIFVQDQRGFQFMPSYKDQSWIFCKFGRIIQTQTSSPWLIHQSYLSLLRVLRIRKRYGSFPLIQHKTLLKHFGFNGRIYLWTLCRFACRRGPWACLSPFPGYKAMLYALFSSAPNCGSIACLFRYWFKRSTR